MGVLKVGDTVVWRDGWGADPPQLACVDELYYLPRGLPDDGEPIQSAPWAKVLHYPRGFMVVLAAGKWAYSGQLEPSPGFRERAALLKLVEDLAARAEPGD